MSDHDDWITAAAALALLKPVLGMGTAAMTIADRAHAGLVRARAERFLVNGRALIDLDIHVEFWWARGHEALEQNWVTGDFATWIDQRDHLQAYGVKFSRADIKKMIPAAPAVPSPASIAPPKGGRPPADWWEDLLVDVCFRYFRGDLKPRTQADIVRAMQEWITQQGYDAADSTVKIRAHKVWQAIKRDAEN